MKIGNRKGGKAVPYRIALATRLRHKHPVPYSRPVQTPPVPFSRTVHVYGPVTEPVLLRSKAPQPDTIKLQENEE